MHPQSERMTAAMRKHESMGEYIVRIITEMKPGTVFTARQLAHSLENVCRHWSITPSAMGIRLRRMTDLIEIEDGKPMIYRRR